MLKAKPLPNRVEMMTVPPPAAAAVRRRGSASSNTVSVTSKTTSTSMSISMNQTNTVPRPSAAVLSSEEERLRPSSSLQAPPAAFPVIARRGGGGGGGVPKNVVRRVKDTTGTAVNFVGVAGKGTVKATRNVGKGVANNAAKIGARTAKGTVTATKLVARNTVGAVSYLPNLAGTTVNGMTQLLPLRVLRQQHGLPSTAAWKTRVTSPITQLELQFECQNLRRKDTFSECDAFCVIWEVPSGYVSETSVIGKMEVSSNSLASNHYLSYTSLLSNHNETNKAKRRGRVGPLPVHHVEKEVGRSDVITGSRNPKFTFVLPQYFHFQKEQTYVIRVYDRDLEFCSDLKEHDFLGGAVFTLGELMGVGQKRTLTRRLNSRSGTRNNPNNRRDRPVVIIRGKEVTSTRSVLEFRFSAQDLVDGDNKKIMDKQEDQFFRISRLIPEDQTWKPVYKSEVVMDDNAPTWQVARIPLPLLCNTNTENASHSPLKISFWAWDRGAESNCLGSLETNVQDLVDGAARGIPVLDVFKDQKRILFGGSKQKKSGKLKILKAETKPIPTMLEYISRGCELDLMIAVDCSTSNGDSTKETGLHYCPGQWLVNDYQAAIQKLGRIFEPYSVRQKFTIWGFGGTVRGETTPLFPMGSGDGIVKGAKGLLDAYDETFQDNPLYVEAVDEAKLAPLIENAMYQAIHNMKSSQCYSVLCILTAGKIADDIHHLIDTICTAAEDAPLSIVIIGVGGNDRRDDLDSMKMLLNNSSTLCHSNGVPISRDIVRFAAFRDFGYNVSDTIAEGLKEVNEQLVEHFTSNGIQPLRRLMSDGSKADSVGAIEEEEDELMAGSGRSQVSEEDADLSIVSRTPASRKKRLSLRKKREKKSKDL